MPIRKVQFTPGEFYHAFNRGNGRQNIFNSDRDRYRFLQAIYLSNFSKTKLNIGFLERHKNEYTLADIEKITKENKILRDPLVKICADCLMPNHFHFLLQELEENGITKFMQRLGTSYAKYFVTKYDRPGSLFQGRFKAVHVKTDEQLQYLIAYINAINPAQLAEPQLKNDGIKNFKRVWEKVDSYKWSTHFEFTNKRESILVDKGLLKKFFPTTRSYYDFIKNILRGKENRIWASIDNLTLE
ncbi:MAG: transposase [Patescibacteria group bacterium]